MFLRFFYVVACMSASFLFMSQCYSPIWIYSTFHLSIYQLMGIWVVSTFWLFCVMLPWAFMYKFLCDHIFYFSWVCTWVCMWVSVQLICPVMPDSLQPHGLQHTRPPCPLPTPRACSNSGPSSWWCHPTISSSVISFSSCFQSFPASGTFLRIRWPKYWSFSFSISPSNEYSGLVGSLCSSSDSQESSPTPQFKSINLSALSFLYVPTLTSIHDYWKKHSFD